MREKTKTTGIGVLTIASEETDREAVGSHGHQLSYRPTAQLDVKQRLVSPRCEGGGKGGRGWGERVEES